MCACSFDMMFTFVYTRWEGTTNDSRVFSNAITRSENEFPFPNEGINNIFIIKLKIILIYFNIFLSIGYYYVVDAGYIKMSGFLSPYRRERYHLCDYRGPRRAPRGPMELFNYKHPSLRNIIENCLGVLKIRFPILKVMPNYHP